MAAKNQTLVKGESGSIVNRRHRSLRSPNPAAMYERRVYYR
jgi:hypothetical protein